MLSVTIVHYIEAETLPILYYSMHVKIKITTYLYYVYVIVKYLLSYMHICTYIHISPVLAGILFASNAL